MRLNATGSQVLENRRALVGHSKRRAAALGGFAALAIVGVVVLRAFLLAPHNLAPPVVTADAGSINRQESKPGTSTPSACEGGTSSEILGEELKVEGDIHRGKRVRLRVVDSRIGDPVPWLSGFGDTSDGIRMRINTDAAGVAEVAVPRVASTVAVAFEEYGEVVCSHPSIGGEAEASTLVANVGPTVIFRGTCPDMIDDPIEDVRALYHSSQSGTPIIGRLRVLGARLEPLPRDDAPDWLQTRSVGSVRWFRFSARDLEGRGGLSGLEFQSSKGRRGVAESLLLGGIVDVDVCSAEFSDRVHLLRFIDGSGRGVAGAQIALLPALGECGCFPERYSAGTEGSVRIRRRHACTVRFAVHAPGYRGLIGDWNLAKDEELTVVLEQAKASVSSTFTTQMPIGEEGFLHLVLSWPSAEGVAGSWLGYPGRRGDDRSSVFYNLYALGELLLVGALVERSGAPRARVGATWNPVHEAWDFDVDEPDRFGRFWFELCSASSLDNLSGGGAWLQWHGLPVYGGEGGLGTWKGPEGWELSFVVGSPGFQPERGTMVIGEAGQGVQRVSRCLDVGWGVGLIFKEDVGDDPVATQWGNFRYGADGSPTAFVEEGAPLVAGVSAALDAGAFEASGEDGFLLLRSSSVPAHIVLRSESSRRWRVTRVRPFAMMGEGRIPLIYVVWLGSAD